MSLLNGYTFDNCLPLPDDTLADFIEASCLEANSRVWASVFLVDPRPTEDTELRVRQIIEAMADAAYRGVDARLIVPWSATPAIAIANRTAVSYAHSLGLATQLASVRAKQGSHSKFLVIDDDRTIVGSHNWTGRAFAADTEDSICVWSRDLNAEVADIFLNAWEKSYAA